MNTDTTFTLYYIESKQNKDSIVTEHGHSPETNLKSVDHFYCGRHDLSWDRHGMDRHGMDSHGIVMG